MFLKGFYHVLACIRYGRLYGLLALFVANLLFHSEKQVTAIFFDGDIIAFQIDFNAR